METAAPAPTPEPTPTPVPESETPAAELPDIKDYYTDKGLDLESYLYDCGFDEVWICLDEAATKTEYYSAFLGDWNLKVATDGHDPNNAYIFVYTPKEVAVTYSDYSGGKVRCWIMGDEVRYVDERLATEVLPKLVEYVVTHPGDTTVPYDLPELGLFHVGPNE